VDISRYNIDVNKVENINNNIIDKLRIFITSNSENFKIRPKIKRNEQIITSKYNMLKEKIDDIKSKIFMIKKYIYELEKIEHNNIEDIKDRPILNTQIDDAIKNFNDAINRQRSDYDLLYNKVSILNRSVENNNVKIYQSIEDLSKKLQFMYDKLKKNEQNTNENTIKLDAYKDHIDNQIKNIYNQNDKSDYQYL
jgi:septal ring factor EnvC (AmiA/AmiB activator)